MHFRSFLFYFLVCIIYIHSPLIAQDGIDDLIWYSEPAKEWNHALPVGNGRMGAMVFGDPTKERIQLNEDSLWPGGPEWGNAKGTPEELAALRKLILAGQVHLADSLIVEYFSFKGVGRSHQTMGDLHIDLNTDNISDYKRTLNLDKAYVSSSFLADGHRVSQTVFASHPDDVLVVHYKTENPDGLSLSLKLDRPEDNGHKTVEVSAKDEQLIMSGMVTQLSGGKFSQAHPIDHGVKFETILKPIIKGGKIISSTNALQLEKVKEATLLIFCATSYYHKNYREQNQLLLRLTEQMSYEALLSRHIKDYQQLYNRVSLNLNGKKLDHLSAPERLQRIKSGETDVDLEEKLFQFGRYLLISCSRPGTNPANLQGLWNEHIQAPWNADYHLNINIQMNYWPAGVTNLSECHLPLFELGDRLVERGKLLAKEQYGMNGTIIHHTTDLWAPPWMRAERAYWGSWIHGGGWLSRHYWEHFQYTQDTTFLRKRAYPALKEFSTFYLDWLMEDPEGDGLISVPETSPENSYIAEDGKPAAVAAGAAMGYQIIQDVFGNTLEAAKILAIEDDLSQKIVAAQKRLPTGLEIGPDGRLLEWSKPYDEPEKGHRHISHLYALHPDDAIAEDQQALFAAANKTIQHRLDHGGAGPGWSRAWIINFYARLLQGDVAHEHVRLFLNNSIYPNLMDIHPPFQIDGNFGFTAGLAEMLLQSHEGAIRILPALPKDWPDGEINGLKARGDITVNISWKSGQLLKLELTAASDKKVKVKYHSLEKEVALQEGEKAAFGSSLEIIKE